LDRFSRESEQEALRDPVDGVFPGPGIHLYQDGIVTT
jgi:hypothetical protein